MAILSIAIRIIAVSVLMLPGSSLTIMAADAQIMDRTPSPPTVHDLDGNLLDRVTSGHQVALSQTFTNNENAPQPFTALFEIRDLNGFTVYLAWQSGTMAAGGQQNIDVSWVADGGIGEYQIRTFHISSLTNSGIAPVEVRQISVIEDADA